MEAKMNQCEFFLVISFLVMIGALLSSLLMHFLAEAPTERGGKEVLKPVIVQYIEDPIENLVNFASSINGATIFKDNSSPEYHGIFTVFTQNSIDSLLEDNNSQGNCWLFGGKYGHAEIRLKNTVVPSAFTMYHINSVDFANAPKNFNVWAIEPRETVFVGAYYFNMNIESETRKTLQVFESSYRYPVRSFVLEVVQNYGANSTCVYQFGVHGQLAKH